VKVARIFNEATSEVEDAMLLVTPDGEIVAANRAALVEFQIADPATAGRLSDLLQDDADRVADFLRRCSGSKESIPASLTCRPRDGFDSHEFRCDGALFWPEPEEPPLLKLRLRRKEAASRSFALLTQQIDELNREITSRKRYEIELSEALREQALLLRELQHRVRNTIQLFLSLLNRESRRAGSGAVDWRSLAAKYQAVGIVQKQVSSAADLSRVEVGRVVRDILEYLHPSTQADPSIQPDLEHIELPIEVATPLALLFTECLVRSDVASSPQWKNGIKLQRIRPGRLVLSIVQPGASDIFLILARDQLVVTLAAQMDGSVAYASDGDIPRIVVELPIPGED
jgi:hypothetical protein